MNTNTNKIHNKYMRVFSHNSKQNKWKIQWPGLNELTGGNIQFVTADTSLHQDLMTRQVLGGLSSSAQNMPSIAATLWYQRFKGLLACLSISHEAHKQKSYKNTGEVTEVWLSLLSGFAMDWWQNRVTRQPHLPHFNHIILHLINIQCSHSH